MKFSEKMLPIIILKVTKNQGFTLSLEDTIFERPQEESQIDGPYCHPHSCFRVNPFATLQ